MAQKINSENSKKKIDPFFTGLMVTFIAAMIVFGVLIVVGLLF